MRVAELATGVAGTTAFAAAVDAADGDDVAAVLDRAQVTCLDGGDGQ